MKVLVDTNIIIDILDQRKGFFQNSYRVIQLALQGRIEAVMSAGSVTDVYYIINRSLHDANAARGKIIGLAALVNLCDTTASDINAALSLPIADFEDAVIAAIARREKTDYIVTRNGKDYKNSPVPAVSPDQLLQQFTEEENGQ